MAAQPMHCDYAGCDKLAEWISSRIENGDTFAWCDAHWLFLAQSIVAAAEQAQAEQLPPEDQPQPEPAAAAGAELDGEPEQPGGPLPAAEAPESARTAANGQEVVEPQEPDQQPVAAGSAGPGGTRVVKRGTSPSRRAYQARVRAKKQAAESADLEE